MGRKYPERGLVLIELDGFRAAGVLAISGQPVQTKEYRR